MYKYIFGPVPSRRLGMSLGIDLVPHKVCSLNCIYCECGDTTNLTTERKEYVLFEEVIEELNHCLANNPTPDYITFSGSGEPTLNNRIGDILSYIKNNYPDIPVALLTNGTLLNDEQVRREILACDLILPSLDATLDLSFKKINRPSQKLNLNDYVNGLIHFSKEFKGKIWLEILILPGYNDSNEDLVAFKEVLLKIKADSIQLNTLDRPGAIENIRAATRKELENIIEFWNLPNVEIIAANPNRKKIKAYRQDTETAILETIHRRPCTLIDLSEILGLHINEINKYLDVLETENKIKSIHQERGLFYHTRK